MLMHMLADRLYLDLFVLGGEERPVGWCLTVVGTS